MKVRGMINEIERVLQPGGRYITFSLHSIEEILPRFQRKPILNSKTGEIILEEYGWKISTFRVKSNRWNLKANRRRAVAHTMIICDKPLANIDEDGKKTTFPYTYPLDMPNVLTEEEYDVMKARFDEVINCSFSHVSLIFLIFVCR